MTNDLIVELFDGGHRPSYVEAMAIGGYRGRYLLSSEVYRRLSPSVRDGIYARTTLLNSTLNSHMKRCLAVREFCIRSNADYRIFFLYLDDYLIPLVSCLLADQKWGLWADRLGGLLFHNHAFRAPKSVTGQFRANLKLSALRALALNCVSLQIRVQDRRWGAFLREQLHGPAQVSVVPEPVLPRQLPTPYLRAAIQPGEVVVGFLGAHSPRKGTSWALGILAPLELPCRYLIAGDMKDDPVLADMLKDSSAPPGIINRSYKMTHEEIVDWMACVHIVVMPYIGFYGSSAIMAHARSMGKIIVASKIGVVADSLEGYKNAIFFCENDGDALRKAVEAALMRVRTVAPPVPDTFYQHNANEFARSILGR